MKSSKLEDTVTDDIFITTANNVTNNTGELMIKVTLIL